MYFAFLSILASTFFFARIEAISIVTALQSGTIAIRRAPGNWNEKIKLSKNFFKPNLKSDKPKPKYYIVNNNN